MRKLLVLILAGLLLPQCGKKKKHFFHYEQVNLPAKVNRLTLPSIKGFSIKKENGINILKWYPIEEDRLIGYFVYRFIQGKFIRKNPINKNLIIKTIFYDKPKSKYQWCYIIRAVFQVEGQVTEGPSSRIICA
ncbi:hypothetical protein KAW80_03440 [Candidatus Babeliales bacterium]|nr:hypothetical protein [Candidatus Babeliales bacterium]